MRSETQLASSVRTVLAMMIAPASRRFLVSGLIRPLKSRKCQRAAGGRHVCCVDVVLERDGDAVQRPADAARASFAVTLVCFGQRARAG